MAWTDQLLKTYEMMNSSLTPIAHQNVNAQIEVTIGNQGDFKNAQEIDKKSEDRVTLIPVSEASAGRSSGVAPHALCDTLSYVAGDFADYCSSEKESNKVKEKNEKYMEQLKCWAESEYSCKKVQLIFEYLSKKRLIEDLVKLDLIKLKEDGTFSSDKIQGNPYEKAMVRFRVFDDTSKEDACWKDCSLIQNYTDYYLSEQKGKRDICYLTGKQSVITENNPKGIVASNYGAKLISANDGAGFTYRGRFENEGEACAVSYEASQKMHSALTWLAETQGVSIGTSNKRTFVCWSSSGNEVPNPFNNPFAEESSSFKSYKTALRQAFAGKKDSFSPTDEVIVLALDAATTGRLSITYYQELNAYDFIDRMLEWDETCCWYFWKKEGENSYKRIVKRPTFLEIARCAYGRESDKGFLDVDDRILKEQVQRLVRCMLGRQNIPRDLMLQIVSKASNPMAYKKLAEYVLDTACAVISKYHNVGKGDIDYMKLDLENSDRSYLYGRLLAVLEKIERSTYKAGETREPNAIRYQSAYVNHPQKTWKMIEEILKQSYYPKLQPGSREYYKNLITSILETVRPEDYNHLDQRLKETYLLGYYLQRAELNKKKESQED